ncbi:hypothetical protein XPA_010473 [Xanthoria parietina]
MPSSEKHQASPYTGAPKSAPGPSMSEAGAPSGPPAPDYNTPRILHIYRDGISHRHMTITDMDKSHPLYKMDQNAGTMFSSKPHMTITSASGSTMGSATFHNSSRTIDLQLHEQPVAFESEGMFTRAYAYQSPAFGERLRWECEGIWGSDLVLVNGRKEWIARFEASTFSMSKTGTIHVVHGGISGMALDEIMVSGCAMVEQQRRRRNSNGAASGGGAAAGGG